MVLTRLYESFMGIHSFEIVNNTTYFNKKN